MDKTKELGWLDIILQKNNYIDLHFKKISEEYFYIDFTNKEQELNK